MLDSAPDAAWSELGQDAALQTRTEELALLKYSLPVVIHLRILLQNQSFRAFAQPGILSKF